MSILINNLVEELLRGLKDRLQSYGYFLKKEKEKILRRHLLNELRKPSIEQSRTPTQIVNDFLNEEFNESFNLTPANFGEKAHKLIMEWGFQKTKDMNEQ
tara:strand:+ start:727 stop:1026 length:300 start_codon:yes stop_codon:yes gene_type:complete